MKLIRRKRLIRLLVVLLPLVWFAAGPSSHQAQRSQGNNSFARSVQPFLAQNCYACHNAQIKTGGLNLEAYKTAASITQDREKWERILEKLRTGEMPPKGMPRPNETELKAVIGWIESEFARADRLIKPDPGRVTARRLNRAEYNNTVHDLLGVSFRPADDFPQDDSGYGFDNIGDVLSLSPVLMEKYLAAAERAARAALFGPEQIKPTLVQLRPPGRRIIPTNTPIFDYDLTGLSLPNAAQVVHRFPVDGEYVINAVLGGARPAGSEPIQIALWVDGEQTQMLTLDPDTEASFSFEQQELGGKARQFRARIAAGEHWIAVSLLRLYEGLPPSYRGPNPSKRPLPEFKPPPGAPPARVAELRKRFEAQRAEVVQVNSARISYLEVSGPFAQAKGPSAESLKKVYACGHFDGRHQAGCERKIVAGLARRAYRRPVVPEEVDRLVRLAAQARQRGDSFEEGLSLALQAMLISPHFLFRIERDHPGARAARADGLSYLSQHELASRLSYFLWSSMPDEELLRLADQGILRQPVVLGAQVRRMLKDAKARALVENFGGQWLELRKLESVKPNRQRYPEFDEYLRFSMRRETEMFFEKIIRDDRSIGDFIDSNYTFLNERLAQFYHIPGVKGPEFRKVDLTGNKQRGGVLTQASILTVSSYATRTSPVLRGKWILENMLNAPPPPPPPDVPNLDEAKVNSSALLRQQLEEHRKNVSCASCHARIDPLGFGLENFDAIGAWRTQDGTSPIDSSGTLPDGRSFKGPAELKAILKADRDAFTECLTEKMLTYALGRGMERYDKPVVKQITRRVSASNYRFSSLVLEIVKSLPFQMRRGVASNDAMKR
jgi:mono/diheme cytochrome c family protein